MGIKWVLCNRHRSPARRLGNVMEPMMAHLIWNDEMCRKQRREASVLVAAMVSQTILISPDDQSGAFYAWIAHGFQYLGSAKINRKRKHAIGISDRWLDHQTFQKRPAIPGNTSKKYKVARGYPCPFPVFLPIFKLDEPDARNLENRALKTITFQNNVQSQPRRFRKHAENQTWLLGSRTKHKTETPQE